MNMKANAALALTIFGSLLVSGLCAPPPNEKMREIFQSCMKEFNAQEAAIRDGTADKCVYKCIETKSGIMDANGKFNINGFKSAHSDAPAEFLQHATECVEKSKASDACDAAKLFHECMHEHMPHEQRH